MNFKEFSCILGLTIGIIASHTPKASALDWNFSYTAAGVTTSGKLVTDGSDYNQVQYNITDIIGGTRGSNPIQLIPKNSNPLFTNNNTLYPQSLDPNKFDNEGLLFKDTTTNISYNIYKYSPTQYSENTYNGLSSIDVPFNNITVTPASATVPFEFSPSQGILLGAPLFIGLRMLKRKRALKALTTSCN